MFTFFTALNPTQHCSRSFPTPAMLAASLYDLLPKQIPTQEPFVPEFSEKCVAPRHTMEVLLSCGIPATTVSPPPIRSLPSELLGEIFQHYLNEDEPSIDCRPNPWVSALTTMKSGTASPLLLGCICSQWRSVALSMPTLWSSLAIYRPSLSHLPVIRLWLERSGSCPLKLSLAHAVDSDSTQHAATREILELFIESAARWASIRFLFQDRPPASYGELLMKLPPGTLNALESAHIDLPLWSHGDADRLWETVYSSPSLRRVDWGNRYKFLASNVSIHSIPWAQLTSITMQGVDDLDVEEFMDILQSCQELQELDLTIPWPETGHGHSPTSSIVVPKLRVCRINAWKHNSAVILNRVTFPSLVSLHLVHASSRKNAGQPQSCSYISDFLARSACYLKTFSISDPSTAITEDDLVELLRSPAAQSFQKLSVEIDRITDRTISALTRSANQGVLPNLSILSLSRCTEINDGATFDMVTSRLPALRSISLPMATSNSASQDLISLESLRNQHHSLYRSLTIARK